MSDNDLSQRKSEHLKLVAEGDVSHHGTTLLEDVQLIHQALPELDLEEIIIRQTFFGKSIQAPLMITSMTGGAEFAGHLNRGLARAAGKLGIPFAVGSQRVMLRHPESVSDFQVRSEMPNGVLLGNIGAVQLLEHSLDDIAGLVEAIDADGICVHLNAGQELAQVDGNREFRGLLEEIARLVEKLDGRVLVKETGAGMSVKTFDMLKAAGVRYVDVAGAGGTSWTRVESLRENNGELRELGEAFGDWGIPTAASVAAGRRTLGAGTMLIASGGIRTGLDVARAIALGADIAGFARPVLLKYLEGDEGAVIAYIEKMVQELKVAMLLSGAADIRLMQRTSTVITGRLREWMQALQLMDGERR